MEIIFDKEAINNAVDAILDHKNHDVIRIDGTMGAGKTTLISALCKHLCVEETGSRCSGGIKNCFDCSSMNHGDFVS